jgi:hypothetical protein
MTKPLYKPQVRNILAVMRKCDDESMRLGLSWYDRARAYGASLDPNDFSRAAGVLAVLSPNNSWPQNMKYAAMIYAGATELPYFKSNTDKAIRIFNGEAPLDVIRGPKVTPFYLNLIGDNSTMAVTIDRHAVDIAMGRVCTDKIRAPWIRGKRMASIADMYRRAAILYNAENGTDYSPSQIQAITWVWWRKNRAKTNHGGDSFGE